MTWTDVILGLVLPPFWSLAYTFLGHRLGVRVYRIRATAYATFLRWWKYGTASLLIAVITQQWMLAVGFAVSVAVAFLLDSWRKRRDRIRAWLGAKSRALRDAVVARMPKPVVLRPGLGGAS